MDMGQVKDLFAASEFVKVVEDRQGLKIAVPEEIAWRNGWIGIEDLKSIALSYGNPQYREYLLGLGKFNEYD
jgi:glucose-1-phosphate thymidylyltransferase